MLFLENSKFLHKSYSTILTSMTGKQLTFDATAISMLQTSGILQIHFLLVGLLFYVIFCLNNKVCPSPPN